MRTSPNARSISRRRSAPRSPARRPSTTFPGRQHARGSAAHRRPPDLGLAGAWREAAGLLREPGGFDTHDAILTTHPTLMTRLGAAMRDFYDATAALGVADQVTAFTASDFGRTLTSNANGSDHGWGSMHFVMGGAVNGRAFYGTPPAIGEQRRRTMSGRGACSRRSRSINMARPWPAGSACRRADVDRPAQHRQLQSERPGISASSEDPPCPGGGCCYSAACD